MSIKLVCFDLDGTINDGWNLLPQLKSKLYELRASGVKLAIITGREAIGTLYFVYRSGFPFDYIGCGGGPIIANPLDKTEILHLFEGHTVDIVTRSGLSKTGRLLRVIDMCGLMHSDVLFIDDNNNQSLDVKEISEKAQCLLASPRSNNTDWLNVVKDRGGMVTDKPCGLGTLEILNKVFNG